MGGLRRGFLSLGFPPSARVSLAIALDSSGDLQRSGLIYEDLSKRVYLREFASHLKLPNRPHPANLVGGGIAHYTIFLWCRVVCLF